MPLIIEGSQPVTFLDASLPAIVVTGDCHITFNMCNVTSLTVVGDATNAISAVDTTFGFVDLTDCTDYINLSKVTITNYLKLVNCDNVYGTDLVLEPTGVADGTLDLTDCRNVNLQGSIVNGYRRAIRAEDLVASTLDFQIIHDPTSDNTYDTIDLVGVCDRCVVKGSVRGAVFSANNPRYGLVVAAGCLDTQVDLDVTGAQTGAFNNLAGLETWFHPHVSLEAPAEDDILVWDDTAKIWRPEAGTGGAVDEISELIDVDLTGLANGDVLIWDSGASMWEPGPMAGGGGQAMKEDENPVHADGDTFPGSSLDGAWTETKTSGSDLSEVNYGAYWVGTIGVSGASAFRTVIIEKTVTLSVGDTLIACVEQFTLGDNESLVNVSMVAAASSDAAGTELEQSSAETALIRYFSVASGTKTAVYSERSESFARRFWLGIKYTATNQFQPYASLNGSLWVPVAAASSITLTPARIMFTSGSFNAAGPTLGALHFIDIVTTI